MFSRVIRFIKKAWGNLQVKILVIILLFLFLPVIITLNAYLRHTEQIVIDNTSSLVQYNLKQVGDKVENTCLNMITLSNIILTDDTILENLLIDSQLQSYTLEYRIKSADEYTDDDLRRRTRIENQINSIKMDVFFNNNASVTIIGADGNMYFSLSNAVQKPEIVQENWDRVIETEWFKLLATGQRAALWNVPFSYEAEYHDKKRYISFSKSLSNKYSPQDVAGIIMINFSEDNINKIIGDFYGGDLLLINEKGEIITSSNAAMEPDIMQNKDIANQNLFYGSGSLITHFDNQKYMVNYHSIDRFGYCAISLVPYEDLIEEIDTLKSRINSISVFIFFAFLIFGSILIMYTINPIQRLLNRMKKIKVGAYSIGLTEIEHLDDVKGLVNSFDKMIDRVQELVAVVVEEQKRESELRYQVLRAQINPHFLFNTLSTIKWSAKMSGAQNVSKMISALGMLLEVSINKGEEEVTLREELELVKSYVFIQNARYTDKFDLNIQVKENALYSYRVIKLILQPVVENSIIHGFVDKTEECVIGISAYRKDEMLIIDITDNGVGIDEEKIGTLLSAEQPSKDKFNGIGLNNVHERIQLKYGNQYGLYIASGKEKGTCVSIMLPIIEEVMEDMLE